MRNINAWNIEDTLLSGMGQVDAANWARPTRGQVNAKTAGRGWILDLATFHFTVDM